MKCKIPMSTPLRVSALAVALLAGTSVYSQEYPEIINGEPMPFFDFSQGPGLENYGWVVRSGDPAMQYFVVFPDESLTGHTQGGASHSGTGHIGNNLRQAFGAAFGEAFYYWDSHHPTMWIRSPEFTLNAEGELSVYLIAGGAGLTPPAHESDVLAHSSPQGFMGVVLRNAETGDFVLSGQRTENGDAGGIFEQIVFTRSELDALDQDAVYTLDLIDSYHGGWGWINMDSVDIPGTVFVDTEWHDKYADLTAPFLLDFGEGKNTGQDLLRNRQADLSLSSDGLRILPGPGRTVTALASVDNYFPGRDFVLETEMTFEELATPGSNSFGLVVLGGPHVPGVSPFTSSHGEEFYTLTINSGASVGEPEILRIREGFQGNILATKEWPGTPLFGAESALFDDFEDAVASGSSWSTEGTDLWQVGKPTTGPGAAYSGENVLATLLDGSFQQTSDAFLRSPAIDLTNANAAVVSYADYHQLSDDVNWHFAKVSILDASTKEEIEQLDRTTGVTDGWREREFVLSQASLGRTVILEFHLSTDDFEEVAGWYIDAVTVTNYVASFPASYTLTAEGIFFTTGGMELKFTVAQENGATEVVAATIAAPFDGNLFGFGVVREFQSTDAPSFDFHTLAFNSPGDPVVSSIPTQTIVMSISTMPSSTGPLPFTLQHDNPSSLTVTGTSSNTDLVLDANVVIEGQGAQRTVTVTPLDDEIGVTTITLTATGDGVFDTRKFLVNVVPPELPTITGIPDQLMAVNTNTGPLSIIVGDVYINPELLTLSGTSSNQLLVPDENIVFEGTGNDRTVTVTPASGETGTALIIVTVDNGHLTAGSSFEVMVLSKLPIKYEFRSGTSEGWTIVAEDDLQYLDVVPPFLHNSPNQTPHSGSHFIGLLIPEFGNTGYTQDSPHGTNIVRSPEFTLNGEGNLEVWLFGGGADSGNLEGVSVDSLSPTSTTDGFLGVALRNVTTGIYLLSGTKASNGGPWQEMVFTESQLAELPQDDVYTLDMIDARHGGWGWFNMDSVSIPGTLVNPPSIETPTLTIERLNENFVRLSWSAEAWTFSLQRAFEVDGVYVDPELNVTVEGDDITSYDEIVEPKQFYRLIELD